MSDNYNQQRQVYREVRQLIKWGIDDLFASILSYIIGSLLLLTILGPPFVYYMKRWWVIWEVIK